jgi:hypothetical protein
MKHPFAHFIASFSHSIHGSLEDIILRPQLHILGVQLLELAGLRQPVAAPTLLARTVHPVSQRALSDTKIPGNLHDRLPRLFRIPDSPLTEPPVILLLSPGCYSLPQATGL